METVVINVGIPQFIGIVFTITASLIAVAWKSGARLGRVETLVESVKKSVETMQNSLSGHGDDITALKIHTRYGISHSPTVPNQKGKELLSKSGFQEQYPKLQPKLFSLMDTMNLRTLYDYEKGAMEALDKLKNSPEMDSLKDYAVNNPAEPLELIFKVASWVIRDDYNQHKTARE
jgi:hypothetical protein